VLGSSKLKKRQVVPSGLLDKLTSVSKGMRDRAEPLQIVQIERAAELNGRRPTPTDHDRRELESRINLEQLVPILEGVAALKGVVLEVQANQHRRALIGVEGRREDDTG